MVDIWIAIFVMLIICAGIFTAVCRLSRKINQPVKIALTSTALLGVLVYMFMLKDSVFLVRLLPFKAVIVYSNLLLPLYSIFAGLIWTYPKIPQWRRLVMIVLLFIIAFTPITHLFFIPPRDYMDMWYEQVSIQTDETSCVPAAAATLLKHYGIQTNESQMSALCFTDPSGTSLCGLYRGLRIQTEHTNHRIILGKTNIEQLRTQVNLPVILIVGLTEKTNRQDPRYAERWGWKPGVSHAIVLLEFLENDEILVADPSVGREKWNVKSLQDLWHGTYLAIR